MSSIAVLAATLAYLLPAALLALLLTADTRRPRWLTVVVLALLPLFYIGHYQLLQAVQGWPSSAAVPEQFHLLAFDISEPDPRTDSAGEILLWVRDIGGERPRVHRLPYDKALHQALISAGQLQAEGNPQLGTRARQQTSSGPGGRVATPGPISFNSEQRQALPRKDAED